MNNTEPSKKMRKKLRELCTIAYTRELNHHLDHLGRRFDEWRNKCIDCWDLNELIHEFHDGTSRDLFKVYHYTKNEAYLVSRAVQLGFLQKDELPEGFSVFPLPW
jgi:thiamine kinase-like enzyme